ncbi:MAG TPA: GNAT family N-acetyltransferase [Candidatus Acidoferrum sp.]|jgi:RimJ/RimL family protein N-acetyltransferase|nr:GNAT family N-acetyltransferase [Candidatus Acidoferrum sp.]
MAAFVCRPAEIEDAELASDLITNSYPELPEDPKLKRYFWAHPRSGWSTARYIAEAKGEPVAFVTWTHGPWEQVSARNAYVEVYLDPAQLGSDLPVALWEWVAADALADGAMVLEAQVVEDEPVMIEALKRVGFERDRTEKVWELDLARHGSRLVAEAHGARVKAQAEGIEMLTLAEWSDPDAMRKLHALAELTRRDIPTSFPVPAQSFEDFVERMNTPGRRPDRLWFAADDGQPVALSFLRFPPVRGRVWTGYTCTHPDYRGRGLARGIKLQTLAQAAQLGVPTVLTDNDSENAPMLHINENLGYHARRGFISFVKRVKSS